MLKLLLAPGAMLAGVVSPAALNPAPATAIWSIATVFLPSLVAVTVCEPVLPTTVVTDTIVGVTVRIVEAGCGAGFEFAAEEPMPTQPDAR
jgi:hypothetical protein